MKTKLQSRVAWSNSTTTSWNGNLTSVIYVEDILVCKNRYDWSPSSEETLFCNLYLECSSLNRKFCWALGSIYCLTHDNQVPLQVWDVDAFIFSFRAVFLLQWWQYLRPLAVTSSSVEGKVFLSIVTNSRKVYHQVSEAWGDTHFQSLPSSEQGIGHDDLQDYF